MGDFDLNAIRENILRFSQPSYPGLSPDELEDTLTNLPTIHHLWERPWYDRAPWSYLIGGAVGAIFAIGVAGFTKWLGWT